MVSLSEVGEGGSGRESLPFETGTERVLGVAVVVVGPDGVGVHLKGPCLAEEVGELLLEVGLVVVPLVADWSLWSVVGCLLENGRRTILANGEGQLLDGWKRHRESVDGDESKREMMRDYGEESRSGTVVHLAKMNEDFIHI